MSKVRIGVRLDEDVVDYFRGMGAGWQTALNAYLRGALGPAGDGVVTTQSKSAQKRAAAEAARREGAVATQERFPVGYERDWARRSEDGVLETVRVRLVRYNEEEKPVWAVVR